MIHGPPSRIGAAVVGLATCLTLAGGTVIEADSSAPSSAQQLYDSAVRHERNDRPRKAMGLYRRLLRLRPDHDAAYDRLRALDRRLPLPTDRDRLNRLAERFPSGTRMRRTEHYLILYDGSDAAADSRAFLLERAYSRFYEQLRADGWRPLPPDRRLVCLLFTNHADYLAYARKTDRREMAGTGGYYSGRTNRIALYNNRTRPEGAKHADRIGKLRRYILDREKKINAANRRGDANRLRHLRRERTRAIRKLTQLRNQRAQRIGLTHIAQTLHEAVHQLAYNSDIQRRGAGHPFWFSEGLAMSFETAEPAVPFGPKRINRRRRRQLQTVASQDRLVPLRKLVGLRQPDRAKETARRGALYAQSWGLFRMLYTEHTAKLRQYARAVNRQRPSTTGQRRKLFEQTIGPIDRIEREWRRFLSSL